VRRKAAEVVGRDRFLVVHLHAPLEVCRKRDQEGQYAKADSGDIAAFPGVSAEYEAPAEPDLVLPTHQLGVDDCVERIMGLLKDRNVIA
jgi:bifunctional enzyme CysN/CysC